MTVTCLAAAAGVSTDFIYRHRALRSQVEALRRSTTPAHRTNSDTPADLDAASSTLVRRLGQQLADTRRKHREEVAELQATLAAAHGELLALRRQLQR